MGVNAEGAGESMVAVFLRVSSTKEELLFCVISVRLSISVELYFFVCHSCFAVGHGCIVSVRQQRPVNEEKSPVGPWLLALFVFVVCGSGRSQFRPSHSTQLHLPQIKVM